MSIETLKQYLNYNPTTGVFTWLKRTPRNKSIVVGEQAGSVREDGYGRIRILGDLILTHRLAWAFVNNEWPATDIDHLDGNPENNRINNLRLATRSINSQNQRRARKDNKTGLLGAVKSYGKYSARITTNGTTIRLGRFDTAQEAHEAYLKAKRELHEGNTL